MPRLTIVAHLDLYTIYDSIRTPQLLILLLFNDSDAIKTNMYRSAGTVVTAPLASPVPAPTRCRFATAQSARRQRPPVTGAKLRSLHQLAQGLATAVAQVAASRQRATGGALHVPQPVQPSRSVRSSTQLRWSRSVRHSALQRWSSSTAALPSTLPRTQIPPPPLPPASFSENAHGHMHTHK